jgi:hypothetical protein
MEKLCNYRWISSFLLGVNLSMAGKSACLELQTECLSRLSTAVQGGRDFNVVATGTIPIQVGRNF